MNPICQLIGRDLAKAAIAECFCKTPKAVTEFDDGAAATIAVFLLFDQLGNDFADNG